MRPKLTIAFYCLLAAITLHATTNSLLEARSIFSNIPGVGFLQDLTHSTLGTISNAVDSTIGVVAQRTGLYNALDTIHTAVDSTTGAFTGTADQYLNLSNDPDTKRNVSEIISSRKFVAEEYDVTTKDGYILTIQRIVNPLVSSKTRPKLKPVILQHGLMSSSVDWVINSIDIRPAPFPKQQQDLSVGATNRIDNENSTSELHDSKDHPNSLGFYLANEGYDVFLTNSRGNKYGQRHVKMSAWDPKFWDFTFDEQIKYDLPDTIKFVQKLTGHKKVGYVGHSQGTAMMFGLLSEQPEYADIVEPFVALAPVAYVDHSISPVKYFSVYTPIFQHINMWFATSNAAIKYLGPKVCGPKVIRKELCSNIIFLSVGFDEDELDETRVDAYLSHMPSGTSVKNIAHYGQEVESGRFAHFDHGILANQLQYGQTKPPDYDLTKIRSKSIVLFTAENDWLASPIDVARLKADLKVEPYAVFNMTKLLPKFNHIDFVYGKHAGELVNSRIHAVFQQFK